MAPHDVGHAADKVKSMGCESVYITERDSTFGYNNLVVDMRSIPIIQDTYQWKPPWDTGGSDQLDPARNRNSCRKS